MIQNILSILRILIICHITIFAKLWSLYKLHINIIDIRNLLTINKI